ncbi:PREDICTED: uncharacterized protein LOC109215961 [Nicotiana attenuata]|uniref:uncharacterized protein LOC109215961 n=1 Tax=Nicotiana attenuata TaxID=49451 RepID=UPI0009051929|nr:PREDICTED: uncharacterized protein LOC109215961 [Nicotiana attenuata]
MQTGEQREWEMLFNRNKMAARGMNLSYIALIIQDGVKIVELNKEKIEKGSAKWRQSLILYVVGEDPTIGVLERFIAATWNFASKPKVFYHNDGYFVVRFNSIEDKDVVLCSAPYTINSKPIIIKSWAPTFNFHSKVLQTIPLWVKLPNLPLSCWEGETLSRIGSGLGVPVYADECTTKVERISYARLLVEMNVTRPLPKTIKVKDPTGDVYDQEIVYDWVPEYCHTCLQAGHLCNLSQNKKAPVRRTGNSQGNEGQNASEAQGEKRKGKQIEEKQNEIEGTSKETNLEDDQSQGGQWQIVRNKSATKGSYNKGQRSNSGEGTTTLTTAEQFIHAIYGLHTIEDRRGLWDGLRNIQRSQQDPLLAMGDYNAVLQAEDRKYGNPVSEIETKDFSDFLFDTGVTEMKSVGREYTWTNTRIYSKIDRALVNSEWCIKYHYLEANIMDPHFSDHSPLCFKLKEELQGGPRPFRFLNCLADHENFIQAVAAAWNQRTNGTGMNKIWQKLKS